MAGLTLIIVVLTIISWAFLSTSPTYTWLVMGILNFAIGSVWIIVNRITKNS
jgi:hypothetical protein